MLNLPGPVVPDPEEYCAALNRKLYDVRELVEANIIHSAIHSAVLLNNPSKQKLSPQWIGPFTVVRMKGPTSVELNMGATNRIIHVNHVCPLLLEEDEDHPAQPNWTSPLFNHEKLPMKSSQPSSTGDEAADPPVIEPSVELSYVTRSERVVKPVQRYGT